MCGALPFLRKNLFYSFLYSILFYILFYSIPLLRQCLSDSDVAVRRGAAECAGLLARLLGGGYVSVFLAAAQAKLADTKTKEEGRAG